MEVRRLLAASVVDGVLLVEGTDADDQITVRGTFELDPSARTFVVTIGSEETTIPAAGVSRIVVQAGGGDDSVRVVDLPPPDTGGPGLVGKVTVEGGDGDDALEADAPLGAVLLGGIGNDRLVGGSARDTVRGGAGNDNLQGGDGRDDLWGGTGGDEVDGGPRHDRVRGGSGRDSFVSSDTGSERLDFGPGDRQLLRRLVVPGGNAYVSGGILYIRGTEGGETITVSQDLIPAGTNAVTTLDMIRFNYSIRQGDRVIESGSASADGVHGIRVDAAGDHRLRH